MVLTLNEEKACTNLIENLNKINNNEQLLIELVSVKSGSFIIEFLIKVNENINNF